MFTSPLKNMTKDIDAHPDEETLIGQGLRESLV